MTKHLIPMLLVSTVFFSSPNPASGAEVKVVTTVPDLAWIVQEVGGDRVEVKAIAKGFQDPHYLEAKPSYTRDLRKADLLVLVGLELEVGWLPQLLKTARNPNLRPGSPNLVEASAGAGKILEIPSAAVDRSQGDIHPFGNPHYLLDPRNISKVGQVVADALTHIDPQGGDIYQSGAARLRRTMAARIKDWESRGASLRGHPVVAFHKQWEYLADWLGLEIVGYVENRPGVPSSPKHVKTLIKMMKEDQVDMVMAAPFVDIHAAEEVARRTGARLAVLPAATGAEDHAGTYPAMIEIILTRLLKTGS